MAYKSFATTALAGLALALSGCNSDGGGGGTRDSVRAVGSSTVLPFAKVVAETYARDNPGSPAPLIESNGTGGGIAQFCQGVGAQTPDIANASRRMKVSEFETCQANGVTDITEIQVGLDGIAFAAAKGGIQLNLTPQQVYEALAANPYGEPNQTRNWSDVDPSLPNQPILVYGPPDTSGTSDALKELIMEPGCAANADMAALEESDEDRYDQVCTEIRNDGAFVRQGEQDNLIVQKLGNNSGAIGIFGYSYLEENLQTLDGVPINGVEPTYENISNFSYPGARPLFIYVKKAHLDAIPGLRGFVTQWAEMWQADGPLTAIGLIASPTDANAASTSAAQNFPSLTAADLSAE